MKKLLLTIACALTAMAGVAETKTFTDQLQVTVNDDVTTQQTAVTVEELQDGYINFVLKNFILTASDGNEMYVGNIEIDNLFLHDKGDYKTFSYNANLQIKDGDKEGVDSWMGPLLGNVPLVLRGKITDEKVYVTIDIDMQESLEQTIYVKFGNDFTAAPTVSNALTLTNTLQAQLTSTNAEDKGSVVKYDDVKDYATVVEELSNNDINVKLNNIILGIGGETAPLGSLVIENAETIDRGSYKEFSWSGNVGFDGTGAMGSDAMPISIKGKYSATQIYYTLSIDASASMMAVIDLQCGTDFAPATPSGDAKTYNDKLVVTVNESSTDPMDASVIVTPLTNGGINFTLKNFTMELNGDVMHVGNIEIEDLKLYEAEGYKYFNYNDEITIAAGDEEGVAEDDYIGPLLGEIPLRMFGRITDDKLYVNIDIDMESLEQIIHVAFGEADVTGIKAISADETGKIYDLAGRQVSNVQHGVYIINGKKVMK